MWVGLAVKEQNMDKILQVEFTFDWKGVLLRFHSILKTESVESTDPISLRTSALI